MSTTFRCILARSGMFVGLLLGACDSGVTPDPEFTVPVRLTPAALSSDGEVDAAWAVADRDTATRFRPTGETVTAHFAGPTTVALVRVFGASDHLLSIRDGSGHRVLGPLDLSSATPGSWSTYDLDSVVSVRELRLAWQSTGGAADAGDIEFWADGVMLPTAYAPGATANEDGELPHVDVLAANESTLRIGSGQEAFAPACVTAHFTLARHPGVYRRAWIRYAATGAFRPFVMTRALNHHSTTRGHWVPGPSDGGMSFVYPIDPEQLELGENEAHFCVPSEPGARVDLARIELIGELDHGGNFVEAITSAPRDAAPAADASGLLTGDGSVDLEGGHELIVAFDRLMDIRDIQVVHTGTEPLELRCVSETNDMTAIVVEGGPSADGEEHTPRRLVGGNRCAGVRIGTEGRVTVSSLRVYGSGAARRVDFPQIVVASAHEHFGYQAWVDGWVRAPSSVGGGVVVTLDGDAVGEPDGVFGRMLRRTADPDSAWVVTVGARLADGTQTARQVVLSSNGGVLPGSHGLEDVADDGLTPLERAERYGEVGETAETRLSSGEAGSVDLGSRVSVSLPAGAVTGTTTVSITHLGASSIPELAPGMVNVTAPFAHAFEFLPHGTTFNEPVTVTLPYQENLIPAGYTVHDVETWYYDEDLERWDRLARDTIEPSTAVVRSLSDHFTVMINAIVVTPEHPESTSFDGNQMSGLEAAHPGAGITLIDAPSANSRGDASLQYPLAVPPGRRGMQPQLALTYNSSGGNGFVGVGWDLPVSFIAIDTRFGVPRYSTTEETETYARSHARMSDGLAVPEQGDTALGRWKYTSTRDSRVFSRSRYPPRAFSNGSGRCCGSRHMCTWYAPVLAASSRV